MQKFGVQGKLTAQPGHGEELLDLLLQAAQGMEAVEGCDCYIVGSDPKEPDSVWSGRYGRMRPPTRPRWRCRCSSS